MSKGAVTTEAGVTEAGAPAAELLAPLLQGDFLLTDARGMVSRWGTSASRLFGWRSEDVIGRSLFDAVLSSGGGEWRRQLEVGEGPSPPAQVNASGKRDDGHKFPIELLFLPVLLSESLELSRLLEVVGTELSPEDKVKRLRRDHSAALDSIVAAATDAREESDDTRLAGLVVTYRPLGETPWTEEPPSAPASAPKPAAVGAGEEQLMRVGKLERAEEELREALERETGELSGSLARETGELKETLARETSGLRAAFERETADAKAAVERETSELRAALEQEAAELRAALESEMEARRAAVEAAAAAREDAAAAREDAAAARAVADRAHALAEELHIDEERRRRERVEADREAPPAAQPERPDAPPSRSPREGFDGVAQAMAVIGLDGRFEQLNSGFESLVGYTEYEFRRARWPSLVDADNLVEYRELLAKLAAGEVAGGRIDTVYLHGQGLLVPVVGEMRLERDADGLPSHTVLTVDR